MLIQYLNSLTRHHCHTLTHSLAHSHTHILSHHTYTNTRKHTWEHTHKTLFGSILFSCFHFSILVFVKQTVSYTHASAESVVNHEGKAAPLGRGGGLISQRSVFPIINDVFRRKRLSILYLKCYRLFFFNKIPTGLGHVSCDRQFDNNSFSFHFFYIEKRICLMLPFWQQTHKHIHTNTHSQTRERTIDRQSKSERKYHRYKTKQHKQS